jgi:tripeptide aminopeptidase
MGLCRGIQATEPRSRIRCEFEVNYRNMAKALRRDRRPLELAREAMRRVGLDPRSSPIRGGTDGTQLSGRGLATPNLSCGQHNVHGPLEWVSLQEMGDAVSVCVQLARLWAERGEGYSG